MSALIILASAIALLIGTVALLGVSAGFILLAIGLFATVGWTSVQRDMRCAWSRFTIYCGAQAFLLLAAFSIWLPLRYQAPPLLESIVDCFFGSTVAVSGPLGIVVTEHLEIYFPYDGNWTYLIAMVTVATIQWAFLWYIGKHFLVGKTNTQLWRFVGLLIVTIIVFVGAFFWHLGILLTRHA